MFMVRSSPSLEKKLIDVVEQRPCSLLREHVKQTLLGIRLDVHSESALEELDKTRAILRRDGHGFRERHVDAGLAALGELERALVVLLE
jgi:hypothetical protein